MSTFADLDQYLAQDFSANYWSDDAITYAQELVRRLQPAEWGELRFAWALRPLTWQRRCAEILNWGDARYAVGTLMEMSQSADDEVVVAAADSLRALHDDGVDVHLSPGAERRLREVVAHGGLNALAIRALVDAPR